MKASPSIYLYTVHMYKSNVLDLCFRQSITHKSPLHRKYTDTISIELLHRKTLFQLFPNLFTQAFYETNSHRKGMLDETNVLYPLPLTIHGNSALVLKPDTYCRIKLTIWTENKRAQKKFKTTEWSKPTVNQTKTIDQISYCPMISLNQQVTKKQKKCRWHRFCVSFIKLKFNMWHSSINMWHPMWPKRFTALHCLF